jgi:light-harvesting complex I chlorophyll a/b binding protein 1
VSAAPAKPSLATLEVQKAGATAPFGFFDPLGLSEGKSVKELKKWRESELKHGRIAMLATVGVIVQEVFSPFYAPEFGSADPGPAAFHFQKLEAVNPFVLGYIAVLVAVLEAFTISKGWDSKGEYGTPPSLKHSYAHPVRHSPLPCAPFQVS